MCVMQTKQFMSKSMMHGGSDALSFMSVRHFLMKILNLEKKLKSVLEQFRGISNLEKSDSKRCKCKMFLLTCSVNCKYFCNSTSYDNEI